MTEIVKAETTGMTLTQQMDYARTVASGSLLPQSYKDNPANVMIALGLGQAMGLAGIEALYRIDVIQGKPTASAELIASNVRKAGHKLRVVTDEAAMSVTATIIRADDPEFPHTVTRDMAWAQKMGLNNKDNYKKQPLTMLEWRAISACARKACSEALYGVTYTPDELGDLNPGPDTAPRKSGMDRLRQQTNPEPMEDLGEKPARDFLAEAEALDGDVDGLRALWLDAQAAGEPRPHLGTIAAMATPADEAPAS